MSATDVPKERRGDRWLFIALFFVTICALNIRFLSLTQLVPGSDSKYFASSAVQSTSTSTVSSSTPKSKNNVVHVLFGLSGNHPGFLAEFEVALKSVLMNMPLQRELNVHVMADGKAFAALPEIFSRTGVETWKSTKQVVIHTYNVSSYVPTWKKQIAATLNFSTMAAATGSHTVGTFFRLFAHHVLPASVDQVLYIDTDVVIMSNLDALWWDIQLTNENNNSKNNKTTTHGDALFHWSGTCADFVVLNMKRMDEIWELASRSPLQNISNETGQNPDDQLIFLAVNHSFPEEVALLPSAWSFTVTELWRPKFHHEKLVAAKPDIGMLHFNGGGSSKEPYFKAHTFLRDFNDTWGNAMYYATMPWPWARYTVLSLIPDGQTGYPLQIVSHP